MYLVPNLPKEEEEKRLDFSERNYTCLESLICMHYIGQNIAVVDFATPSSYILALNNFIAFQGHSGRLMDNLKRTIVLFLPNQAESLILGLKDLYQKRNEIIHGKKLPFIIEDQLLLVAEIKGSEENRGAWTGSMLWKEYESDMIFISDFYKESVIGISKCYNNILYNLKKPIFEIINNHNIVIEFPESSDSTSISGNTINETQTIIKNNEDHGISGYKGYTSISGYGAK